jgi:hypothetical protein
MDTASHELHWQGGVISGWGQGADRSAVDDSPQRN